MQNNYDYDGFPIDDFAPARGEGPEIHRIHTWQGGMGVALCSVEVLHLTMQAKKGRRCKECTSKLKKLRSTAALARMSRDDTDPTHLSYSKRGFRFGLYFMKSRQGSRHTRGGNASL